MNELFDMCDMYCDAWDEGGCVPDEDAYAEPAYPIAILIHFRPSFLFTQYYPLNLPDPLFSF